eukprot:gb/GECG01002033.1/.p1 GENE.gb/GECG01002033.1/~~gb/GECG01002033.1/.p1  ORF type:complete len:470 (+),score=51.92 gb/GECG01002033.1/:1-1410(+)
MSKHHRDSTASSSSDDEDETQDSLQLFSRNTAADQTTSQKDEDNDDATHASSASSKASAGKEQNGGEHGRRQESANDRTDVNAPERQHSFRSLGLAPWLVDSCQHMGIKTPTAVQANCVAPILEGRDVLASAPTGSGKTAAFALPILQKLAEDPFGPFALVLSPSRELAFQIHEQFQALGAQLGVRVTVVVGGMDMVVQGKALSEQPHIIVATPGRMADMLTRNPMPPDLSRLQFLVLDEADRLLELSFAPDLSVIMEHATGDRQTLLFSATLTENLKKLNSLYLQNPFRYDMDVPPTTVETLKQYFVFVPEAVKLCYLSCILDLVVPLETPETKRMRNKKKKKQLSATTAKEGAREGENAEEFFFDDEDGEARRFNSAIIFVAKCESCQLIAETLVELGIVCTPLHSLMNQRRRLASLSRFKSGLAKILVATDVASRGLDIPEVDLVVNYDLPQVSADYIHRVGRTAR